MRYAIAIYDAIDSTNEMFIVQCSSSVDALRQALEGYLGNQTDRGDISEEEECSLNEDLDRCKTVNDILKEVRGWDIVVSKPYLFN